MAGGTGKELGLGVRSKLGVQGQDECGSPRKPLDGFKKESGLAFTNLFSRCAGHPRM